VCKLNCTPATVSELASWTSRIFVAVLTIVRLLPAVAMFAEIIRLSKIGIYLFLIIISAPFIRLLLKKFIQRASQRRINLEIDNALKWLIIRENRDKLVDPKRGLNNFNPVSSTNEWYS
jgi:hypothetical protein